MKALVLGAGGQLGRALARTASSDIEVVALPQSGLDLTDRERIEPCIEAIRPDLLVNAAAYTAVDRAEAEPERAYAVNSDAVAALARACARLSVRLIHVSTDFVFDGASSRPYRPEDAPNPLSVYGASKLAGERHIEGTRDLDWRIVRTAWVYASSGRNFVLTMLKLFNERSRVQVVADQVGTPTSSQSLAQCVWRLANDSGVPAILHFTDAGVASWYDLAVATYEEARSFGLTEKVVDIEPIATEQYPTAARRPAYSVLDKRSTLARLGLPAVHWRERLREVLREVQR